METHVPTRQTCQRLQELGVELDTQFVYPQGDDNTVPSEIFANTKASTRYTPAPLLSELLAIMGNTTEIQNRNGVYCASHTVKNPRAIHSECNENPAEAACRLLIWLLENNHLDPE